MKHSGRAAAAAVKWIVWSVLVLLGIFAIGIIAKYLYNFVHWFAYGLIALWVVVVGFLLYFFRDPNPTVPTDKNVVVSPAHGTVDVIDEIVESEFMGGTCQRISIFLSPLNVHVQCAPVNGRAVLVKHKPGEFRPATSPSCSVNNENVLIGFESPEVPQLKVGARLIAGILARRIIPWVEPGETVTRGERMSIIEFGSRCDVYLPKGMKINVKMWDKVKGGETILARND